MLYNVRQSKLATEKETNIALLNYSMICHMQLKTSQRTAGSSSLSLRLASAILINMIYFSCRQRKIELSVTLSKLTGVVEQYNKNHTNKGWCTRGMAEQAFKPLTLWTLVITFRKDTHSKVVLYEGGLDTLPTISILSWPLGITCCYLSTNSVWNDRFGYSRPALRKCDQRFRVMRSRCVSLA